MWGIYNKNWIVKVCRYWITFSNGNHIKARKSVHSVLVGVWWSFDQKDLISEFGRGVAFAVAVMSSDQSGKRIELARRRRRAKKFNFTLALRSRCYKRMSVRCNMNVVCVVIWMSHVRHTHKHTYTYVYKMTSKA